jgi:Ca2+-binding RTX toxin-like protein
MGDNGADSINGGYGADQLFGGTGDDTIAGGYGYDMLFGGNGNDVLAGQEGSDTLFGGAGDDTLILGRTDQASGGEGGDNFIINATPTGPSTAAVITDFDPENDTVEVVFNIEDFGNNFNYWLDDTQSSDAIAVVVNEHEVVWIEGVQLSDLNETNFTVTPVAQNENVTVEGNALTGSAGNDDIYSFADDQSVFGLGGDDNLSTTGADNMLFGGAGDDSLLFSSYTGNSGTGYGGAGDDQLSGGATLYGGAGDDELDGAGNLFGGDGNDTVITFSSNGDQVVQGDAGNDVIRGIGSDNTLDGGTGNDRMFILGANNIAYGGSGSDLLVSGRTGSSSFGYIGGNNMLFGGDGNDRLVGRYGDDTLSGGQGHDTFVIELSNLGSPVYIADFVPADDTLSIAYSDSTGRPAITVVDFADGTGADILAGGKVIASVTGAQGLDPSAINFITRAFY